MIQVVGIGAGGHAKVVRHEEKPTPQAFEKARRGVRARRTPTQHLPERTFEDTGATTQ